MKLGKFQVDLLSDGEFALDGGQMFGVIPRVLWEKKISPDDRNRIPMALTSLLVRTGEHTVLIETGIGDRMSEKDRDIFGLKKPTDLLKDLARVGVSREEVDIVINTHLHFDHCGWNLMSGEGGATVPTFPQARYYVQKGEWERGLSHSLREKGNYRKDYFTDATGDLGGRMSLLEGNQEIVPGIRVEVLPGHTRHLQGVWIWSEGAEALFASDLFPTAAHVSYPWIAAFDLFPLETLENKQRLFPELARRGTLVIFPHDVKTPAVRMREEGGRFAAVPVEI